MNTKTTNMSQILLNKVPQVVLLFWIIKILSTTVGETAADFLAVDLNFGLVNTSWIMFALLGSALVYQIRQVQYIPWLYWLNVVLISVVGTLVTDNLVDNMGVSLETATAGFSIALLLTFGLWYRAEKTLDIQFINTRKRELYYWLTILFTFALGTAAGDLLAESLGLGYANSLILFGTAIALIAIAHFKWHLNGIFSFWLVYILTRPLGASLGDYLSQDVVNGGLGIGAAYTSAGFLTVILLGVVFSTVTAPKPKFE